MYQYKLINSITETSTCSSWKKCMKVGYKKSQLHISTSCLCLKGASDKIQIQWPLLYRCTVHSSPQNWEMSFTLEWQKGSTHWDWPDWHAEVGGHWFKHWNTLQAPCPTEGLQHKIHPLWAEKGVTAGIQSDTGVCLVAYGQLVEARVIVTNTPKGPTLWFHYPI